MYNSGRRGHRLKTPNPLFTSTSLLFMVGVTYPSPKKKRAAVASLTPLSARAEERVAFLFLLFSGAPYRPVTAERPGFPFNCPGLAGGGGGGGTHLSQTKETEPRTKTLFLSTQENTARQDIVSGQKPTFYSDKKAQPSRSWVSGGLAGRDRTQQTNAFPSSAVDVPT